VLSAPDASTGLSLPSAGGVEPAAECGPLAGSLSQEVSKRRLFIRLPETELLVGCGGVALNHLPGHVIIGHGAGRRHHAEAIGEAVEGRPAGPSGRGGVPSSVIGLGSCTPRRCDGLLPRHKW